MRQLLREPLVHFLGLGVLLFLLYGWINGGVLDSTGEIVVSRGQLQSLEMQFERTWQRSPTREERQGLVDAWIREEVFYREGLAAGLDRDDLIVRRRVGQKFEYMTDAAPQTPPTTEQLQAWLDAHPNRYAIEPRYSLRQVYFDPARQGNKLDSAIAAALRVLMAGQSVEGDSTLLPAVLDDASAFNVERQFGAEFAGALKHLPVGGWQGPVRSSIGMHLVKLSVGQTGRSATLDETRAAVERDFLQSRREQAKQASYEKLLAKYRVRIESGSADAPAVE